MIQSVFTMSDEALTAEEIALRDAKPYTDTEVMVFRACVLRKCHHDIIHRVPSSTRTLATFAATEEVIGSLTAERAELESKLREAEQAARAHAECVGELEYAKENTELRRQLANAHIECDERAESECSLTQLLDSLEARQRAALSEPAKETE